MVYSRSRWILAFDTLWACFQPFLIGWKITRPLIGKWRKAWRFRHDMVKKDKNSKKTSVMSSVFRWMMMHDAFCFHLSNSIKLTKQHFALDQSLNRVRVCIPKICIQSINTVHVVLIHSFHRIFLSTIVHALVRPKHRRKYSYNKDGWLRRMGQN